MPPKSSPTLPPEISASDVTSKVYGPAPDYPLYYEVKTDHVSARLGTGQLEGGVTGKVSGTIYTKGPCTFEAESAQATKSQPAVQILDLLTLSGAVHIHCLKPAADLYCDRLVSDMRHHLFKAVGHVRFSTADGLQGTMPEAWATQDLAKIASPNLFQSGFAK